MVVFSVPAMPTPVGVVAHVKKLVLTAMNVCALMVVVQAVGVLTQKNRHIFFHMSLEGALLVYYCCYV